MSDENEETGSEFREKFEAQQAELKQARLEVAVVKAGIDTGSPIGKMFVANLESRDGELDPEALAAEWAELSGEAPAVSESAAKPPLDPTLAALTPDPSSVPGASPEAIESLNLSDQAANASVPLVERQDLTAHQAARMAMDEAKQEGRDSTTQMSAYFGTLMSRAAGGDETALWTPESWAEHLRDHGELPA
jgi:hypothetical protein